MELIFAVIVVILLLSVFGVINLRGRSGRRRGGLL
jgi:hypothetical protein